MAALVDEIGLAELTDELLPPHPLNHISPGQVLKAMILNGFGFVSAPLYLFSEFFEGKPVEHLLGAGIRLSFSSGKILVAKAARQTHESLGAAEPTLSLARSRENSLEIVPCNAPCAEYFGGLDSAE